jgi:transposase
MYQVHDWAEVHRLFYREGWAKTRIAERLGMSRNTVVRLLELSEPPTYRRAVRDSKLDLHRGSIVEMLKDDATAPATVIIEHLRRDGYDGGITILKDYLQEVRPLFLEAESRQRTSYLPGEVGHCDWWEPGVWDRDSSIVVPHSRPARLHDEVAALFGAFRIQPVILKPRRPQSKGQVERTIGYLETSFLPLRSFEGITDLQAQHDRRAAEVAFGRHHRRVGAKVGDTWRAERGFLAQLPDSLPDVDRHTEVWVTKDGFCRVGDVDYSVPPGLSGRRLGVESSWTEVVIFSEGGEIARHRRSFVPADVVLDPAHARALRLAREARSRLRAADPEVPEVDLGRYDTLAGVTP